MEPVCKSFVRGASRKRLPMQTTRLRTGFAWSEEIRRMIGMREAVIEHDSAGTVCLASLMA